MLPSVCIPTYFITSQTTQHQWPDVIRTALGEMVLEMQKELVLFLQNCVCACVCVNVCVFRGMCLCAFYIRESTKQKGSSVIFLCLFCIFFRMLLGARHLTDRQ